MVEQPGATQTFMSLGFDLPWLGHVNLFSGIQLDRTSMLFALSGVFLVLVIINGLFKFYINTFKGRLGERMLRRIRFELVDRDRRPPPRQLDFAGDALPADAHARHVGVLLDDGRERAFSGRDVPEPRQARAPARHF